MRFYVGLDADSLAEDLYRNHPASQEGTVSGTVTRTDPRNGVREREEAIALSNGSTSGFDES